MTLRTSAGRPEPLGASVTPDGINFAVFSRNATALYLELYREADQSKPTATLHFDAERNRTGDVWHLFVHGLSEGQLYGFRADGPYTPGEDGSRFNVNKLLTDPYARAICGSYRTEHDAVFGYRRGAANRDLSFSEEDSAPYTVRSVAVASRGFDWSDDRHPKTPLARSVIYEVHLKGLTADPSSGVQHPGTYLGVIERIPHLLSLGVTAIELLPIHHFNTRELTGTDPSNQENRYNYWGYATLGFFAAEPTFASSREPLQAVEDFRRMVKALHQAGIEVILDVVFNHTGEGSEIGPTLSFRGLENAAYYMLHKQRRYENHSGCGNTVNCSHPAVKQLIIDSLRYWVAEMHVDGFRFDLATILGRDKAGVWVEGGASLLHDIAGDPLLSDCKLIAEAWDAGGLYKVGQFPPTWAEWNDRFRDDARRFVRGDEDCTANLARRIGGSADLFSGKISAAHSINFVSAHDGFTLRDVVSYERKHNQANGENNRDGSSHNFGCNHGAEGETQSATIVRLRVQQAKNLLTTLLISRGTPMLLGGDELWRTQHGNNNAYCQDNRVSWLCWEPSPVASEMQRFITALLAFRRRHLGSGEKQRCDPFHPPPGSDMRWHGVEPGQPDWADYSHSLAVEFGTVSKGCSNGSSDDDRGNSSNGTKADPLDVTWVGRVYAAFNAWRKPLAFALPPLPAGRAWKRIVDTAREPPGDIVPEGVRLTGDGDSYELAPRSAIVLLADESV